MALRAGGRRVCFLSNKPIQSRADYAAKLTRLGIPTPRRRRDQLLVRPRAPPRRGEARRALFRDRRAAARRGAAGGRPRAGRRRQGRLRRGGLRPDFRLPEARHGASGGHAARRAARRHEPRPDLSGRGRRDPGRRGHDRRRRRRDGRRVDPIVGKPSPITLQIALDRLALPAGECAVVGDRLETDIAMGRPAGLATHPRPHRRHAAGRPGDRALAPGPRRRARSPSCSTACPHPGGPGGRPGWRASTGRCSTPSSSGAAWPAPASRGTSRSAASPACSWRRRTSPPGRPRARPSSSTEGSGTSSSSTSGWSENRSASERRSRGWRPS